MIFYYTGTGNSSAAAQTLLQPGEKLISMTEAKWGGEYTYTPEAGESVGFVFPVYFYGVPATVREFINNVRFTAAPDYTYTVITCGGSIAGAGGLVEKALEKNGTALNAVYSVKMPDNYVILYNVTAPEEEKSILAEADRVLGEIRESIAARRTEGLPVKGGARASTALLYPLYDRMRNTKKFYTVDTCVGCGACAARCPAKAIELMDGKPAWVEPKCDHCMSCLSCNAVQYGKRTVGRLRYKHPSLRKNSN